MKASNAYKCIDETILRSYILDMKSKDPFKVGVAKSAMSTVTAFRSNLVKENPGTLNFKDLFYSEHFKGWLYCTEHIQDPYTDGGLFKMELSKCKAHTFVIHENIGLNVKAKVDSRIGRWVTKKNHFYFLDSHAEVSLEYINYVPVNSILLVFSDDFFKNLIDFSGVVLPESFKFNPIEIINDAVAYQVLLSVSRLIENQKTDLIHNFLIALWSYFVNEYGQETPVCKKESFTEDELLVIRKEMQSQLGGVLDVMKVALKVGVSVSRFKSLLKESTGLTPVQFFKKERMLKARQLIETSRDSLNCVALDLGFKDQSHFTNCFNKFWGYSPSVMRSFANNARVTTIGN